MASGQSAALGPAGVNAAAAAGAPVTAEVSERVPLKAISSNATKEAEQGGVSFEAPADIAAKSRLDSDVAAKKTSMASRRLNQAQFRSAPQDVQASDSEYSDDEDFFSANGKDIKSLPGYLGVPQHFPLPDYEGNAALETSMDILLQHLHVEAKMMEKGMAPFGPEMSVPYMTHVMIPNLTRLKAEVSRHQTQFVEDTKAVHTLSATVEQGKQETEKLETKIQQLYSAQEERDAEIAGAKERVAILKAKKARLHAHNGKTANH